MPGWTPHEVFNMKGPSKFWAHRRCFFWLRNGIAVHCAAFTDDTGIREQDGA